MENPSLLLSLILDIGENLLISGAEVNRVEDTIKRIAHAYGFIKTDVFTITSSIVVTVKINQTEILTQTRRITGYQTNMQNIEKLNALSRRICKEPLSINVLDQMINEIKQSPCYSNTSVFLLYGVISCAFSLFYGGNLQDAGVAFLCGLILKCTLDLGKSLGIQPMVLTVLCSFVAGYSAMFLVRLGVGVNFDKIVIGNIMLLIPGVSFTVSLRDMISGDTISGLLGLCEAVLKALAIAIGFALVIFLWKGV